MWQPCELLYTCYLLTYTSLTLSFQALNLPFLQVLPTVAFLFFFMTDYMHFSGLLTNTSQHIRF